jgi:hypothetical protein
MGTLYTARSGGTAHPEDTFLQDLSDILAAGGVKDLNSTDNHFKVTERGAGVNMSVDVNTGRGFVKTTGIDNAYPVRHISSVSNVVITPNSSGNSRIDAIVLYIDTAASPTATVDNVAKLKAVPGTPAGSPSAPSDADIQTSVGASNPWILLGYVTVANGAANIQNVSISDQRSRFKLKPQIQFKTATDGATVTFDVAKDNFFTETLGGNRTFAVSNTDIGVPFFVKVVQPSAGGPYTPTWWANIDWHGGAPTLSTTADKADTFMFVKKASGRYDGFHVGYGGAV